MVSPENRRVYKVQNGFTRRNIAVWLLLLMVISGVGILVGGSSKPGSCCNDGSSSGYVAADPNVSQISLPYRIPAPLQDLGKPHKVRLIYFIPIDREPTTHYREKITTVMTILADVYRKSLQRYGYETEGLDFHFENGKPKVEVLQGWFSASYYSGWPEYEFLTTWKRVLPEVEAACGTVQKNLYVIFVESYDETSAKYEWPGGVALGARYSVEGGAGMFSSWILRDEFCATKIENQIEYLADDIPIVGRTALGYGRKDSPRYEFIEDGFGAVLHELGHAFGLPHDTRKEHEYIMGSGFRNLRHNYLPVLQQRPIGFSPENALILAHSRFLNTQADWQDDRNPVIRIESPAGIKASDREVTLTLDVQDDGMLGGYVVYSKSQDSVIGGGKLGGKSWQQIRTFPLQGLTAGQETSLDVLVIDRGGNLSSQTCVIPVE